MTNSCLMKDCHFGAETTDPSVKIMNLSKIQKTFLGSGIAKKEVVC